jgi:hypothetical protein
MTYKKTIIKRQIKRINNVTAKKKQNIESNKKEDLEVLLPLVPK